jgi:hypothetical protein
MKAQTWRGVTPPVALALVILAMSTSCQGQAGDPPSATEGPGQIRSEEVQFTSPCSDIVDPWTLMSQDERIKACRELIGSKTAELGDEGFEVQDCQVTRAEVQECGIGTQLACTYTCSNTAE